MKKFFIGILYLFIICFISSCSMNETNNNSSNLYDIQKATAISGDFMKAILDGNINKANEFLNKDKISEDQFNKFQQNKIISYKVDEVIEGADYSYVRYLAVRSNKENITADLNRLELKVVKYDDNYLIDEVNIKGMKEVYKSGETLRIRDEEIGKSSLLLKKKELPTEVFPKLEEVVLTKEDIVQGNFDRINIGFKGTIIAMALKGNDETLIAIAKVNESKEVDGEVEEKSSDVNVDDANDKLAESLEKSVAESIIGYDLIKNAEVQKLLFTDDDGELIVEFKQEGKGTALKVYKNPMGDLNSMNLEELFPSDKYSVTVSKITEEGTYIKVEELGEESYEAGDYVVDFKNTKITKE